MVAAFRPPPRSLLLRDLGRLSYADALDIQLAVRDGVRDGDHPDTLLIVEHDPVLTLGQRGDRSGILDPQLLERFGIDVVQTSRGGNVTYHGPGQVVVYPILSLNNFRTDLRWYVARLEGAVIALLHDHGIDAHRDAQHGVYTERGKIASVGVHVSRWVTMHGVALNVATDVEHWRMIEPCGQPGAVATSMAEHLAVIPSLYEVRETFARLLAFELGAELVREAVPHELRGAESKNR